MRLPIVSAVVLPNVRAVTPSILAVVTACSLGFFGLTALAQPVKVDAVEAELIADSDVVVPGQSLQLGLRLRHDPGWHTYWRNPGDSGLPTQFKLTLPDGFTVGEIAWPRPSRFLIPPLANLGYDREVLLTRPLNVPAQVSAGKVRIDALAQWLVCREVCVPGEANLSLTLPVSSGATVAGQGTNAWYFKDAARQVPAAPQTVAVASQLKHLLIHIPTSIGTAEMSAAKRIEYFAHEGEQVMHALPQQLFRLPANAGWRLEVALAAEVLAVLDGPDRDAALRRAATGVLVFDDSVAVHTRAQAAADPLAFAGGDNIGPIEGHVIPFFARTQNAASDLINALRNKGGGSSESSQAVATSAGIKQSATALPPAAQGAATNASMSLLLAVGMALIGGLILNLMPCVFPVIGLKIIGFAGEGAQGTAQLSATQRKRIRSGCAWFAVGVVGSFLLLAVVLLALRSAGLGVGWGFQLQYPPFVALMALLFMAIALNFSGVFEVGTTLTRLGQVEHNLGKSNAHHSLSSFGAGALAVLVATPCTAPFMGLALGYTLTQSATTALIVFAALGLGMALPYLILGVFPDWLRWLPRPGRWMISLRQFLAFPMYAAAAWLAWVLGKLTGVDGMLWLSVAMVVLAMALWLWGHYVQMAGGGRWRIAAMLISAMLTGASLAIAWPQAAPPMAVQSGVDSAAAGSVVVAGKGAQNHLATKQIAWENWSAQHVSSALASGNPVFVDFTASWCVTCQVNKALVLNSAAMQEEFTRRSVRLFKADWTRHDPAITAELARNGRNSVPLYLLYLPDGKAPQVLPELLTRSVILDALNGVNQ